MEIHGKLVDIHTKTIFSAKITVEEGKIAKIDRNSHRGERMILPGFVDPHIHIESSLLPPSEFARMAVRHGTVATVSDPHEIANVLGISGVEYMLDNAQRVPFKFYFGAPSCVPATTMETAGAQLGPKEIKELLENPKIKMLTEVMNFPAVIQDDPEMMEKIAIARKLDKPIDGHAPGLYGKDLEKYCAAGITSEHECTTLSEAREKRSLGMKIWVREGSTAKNLLALFPLLVGDPDNCSLCCDDLTPDDLQLGHINLLVKRVVEMGMDPIDAIICATKTPTEHYGLDVGLLREGDPADFILVDNLKNFRVFETYINGTCVFKESLLFPRIKPQICNRFHTSPKTESEFAVQAREGKLKVIEAIDGQLLTKQLELNPKIEKGQIVSDLERDILKITVVNRYKDAPPAVGFIKNFGLKKGAIASSIAHDSHNIIAVGCCDKDLCAAINAIIETKGGIAASYQGKTELLPLPIAGIMSNLEGHEVARRYSDLNDIAKMFGSPLNNPFMTLSFMALLVIPDLKMSDQGLFDGKNFSLTSLFV